MEFLLALSSAIVICGLYLSQGKRRVPPGPRPLPVVGNVLDIPANDPWLKFTDWRKQFGSLVYLRIFGQDIVVINSHNVAVELMTRRARVYSNRPWNYVAKELLLGGRFMPFMDYHDRCRRLRRAAQEGFRKSTLLRYREIQQAEASRAVTSLASAPDSWTAILSTTAASAIVSSVYGFPPTDDGDPDVKVIRTLTERVAQAVAPGANLVDALPSLRHLPAFLSPWHRDTRGVYDHDDAVVQRLFRSIRHDDLGHSAGPTFARTISEKVDEGLLDETDAAWLCATLFAAGAETTSSALCWFIVSMALHGDVQAKAHEELDRIVGQTRSPSFDDKDKLTYMNAVVHEVLRWRPPLPIGVPHCSAEDDVYEGFNIPRGTLCIPNVWAINRDPEVWGDDAELFRPERHLDKDGSLRPHILTGHEDSHTSFGYGNRVCPGKHFANDTMFITCATLLWAYRMNAKRDTHGQPLLPPEYANVGTPMTLHPPHFPCDFTPRFPDALQRVILAQAVSHTE